MHGKPLRTSMQIANIYNICSNCPNFEKVAPGEGDCGICGCTIKAEGTTLNKAAWATTKCPDKPPRW